MDNFPLAPLHYKASLNKKLCVTHAWLITASALPWHRTVALDCGLRFQTNDHGLQAAPLSCASESQQRDHERRRSAAAPNCMGTRERTPEVSDKTFRAPSDDYTGRAPQRKRILLSWRPGSDGPPYLRL